MSDNIFISKPRAIGEAVKAKLRGDCHSFDVKFVQRRDVDTKEPVQGFVVKMFNVLSDCTGELRVA